MQENGYLDDDYSDELAPEESGGGASISDRAREIQDKTDQIKDRLGKKGSEKAGEEVAEKAAEKGAEKGAEKAAAAGAGALGPEAAAAVKGAELASEALEKVGISKKKQCGCGCLAFFAPILMIVMFGIGLMAPSSEAEPDLFNGGLPSSNPPGGGGGGGGGGTPIESGNAIVDAALQWLGTPYIWGGGNLNGPTTGLCRPKFPNDPACTNQKGFDCSGLTRYAVYQGTNKTVTLPRTADAQCNSSQVTRIYDKSSLQPGDLVCFGSPPKKLTHIGIYYGDGKFIEAPKTFDVVKISNLSGRSNFVWGVRINAP